jgi:hypothetical protein
MARHAAADPPVSGGTEFGTPWDGLGTTPPAPAGYTEPVCPRCGAHQPISYGVKIGCGECGHLWQADPPGPPLSPHERAAVRRRLDHPAEQTTADADWFTPAPPRTDQSPSPAAQ